MTSLYRVYAHASSPAFLAQLRNEVVSVLGASAPHAAMRANEAIKTPGKADLSADATKIHTNENSSGLEFRATLRDVWLLCHRLRSADDVGIQVIRRGKFVHTLNDLGHALKGAPIHAFSPKLPKDSLWAKRTRSMSQKQRWNVLTAKGTKRSNFQSKNDKSNLFADESTTDFLMDEEKSLLAHNLRVILKNSKLSDHDEVRAKAILSLEDRSIAQMEKSKEAEADVVDRGDDVSQSGTDEFNVNDNKLDKELEKETVRPSMTILIDRNHLSATISAAGHANHALHRRGFRPYTIETSLRETIAAPVISLCQDHSSPLSSLPKEIARLPSASAQVAKLAYGKAIQDMAKFAPDIVNPLISTARDGTVPKLSGGGGENDSHESEQKSDMNQSNDDSANSLTKSSADKSSPLVHARDRSSSSEISASILLDALRQADPTIKVFDPFCGSGTILIESAMKFLGLPARALPRKFAFEHWPIHNQDAYLKLIDEWEHYHEQVYNTYLGFMKHNRLTTSADMNAMYDPFPKFFGSDLRLKSLNASSHNVKVAGLTPFIDLSQGDFEAIIASGYASAVDALRNDKFYEGQLGLKQLPFMQRAEDARNALNQKQSHALVNQRADRKPFEPAKIPSLAGYTMITNVPWGISDEKPRRTSDDMIPDGPRGLNFDRTYVNTTQQESMEDLYFRFGRALYQYGSMFRDVFVLSANNLFEKTTAAGASAARREETKNMRANAIRNQMIQGSAQSHSLIGSSNGGASSSLLDDEEPTALNPSSMTSDSKSSTEALVASSGDNKLARSDVLRPDPSPLVWTKISTFYNQGVKTHLLRLDR